ncbi:MAG: 5'-3' exonuclease [Pseudolysinimonas sp.]
MTDAPGRRMLLDTAALYFRAFYGVPDTVKAPNGMPINAARGLLDIIARLATEFEPTEIVACWDDDWRPQWRVDLIPTYKTHRVAEVVVVGPDVEAIPDPLEAQVPVIREALTVLGIPIVGAAHHEADDVIGTLASTAEMPVDVVTGDRDLFQLVDDARRVRVIYTGRGMANLEVLTDAALIAKTGVRPDQYADYAAMRGDASDGLPGVAGIGEKGAAALLATYGDLNGIIAAAADESSDLAKGPRAKILAAADYLEVAPAVVNVVRDLKLPAFDARIREFTPEGEADIQNLSEKWGLSSSMERAVKSLSAIASVGGRA